ncbi:DMT family transporter [Faunimonas pinastri]|nr:DMT family transporter [Faunimonas pinastri]
MSRLAANLLCLFTALIWGGAFIAQSTVMSKLGPWSFVGLRFLLGALAMLPFVMREGGLLLGPVRADAAEPSAAPNAGRRRGLMLTFAVTGVFLTAQIFQQFGLLTSSVTNVSFLTTLYVVMVPFVMILLFRQWPDWIVWPAVLLAVIGTWLLTGGLSHVGIGDLLGLICAVFWAFHVALMGPAVNATGRPLFVVFWQCLVSGVVATAVGLVAEQPTLAAVLQAAPELAYAGIVSGALAFSFQALGQSHTRAADAAVIFSAEAPFASLFAALILGERLDGGGWLGCGIIFAAVLAVQLVPLLHSTPSGRMAGTVEG